MIYRHFVLLDEVTGDSNPGGGGDTTTTDAGNDNFDMAGAVDAISDDLFSSETPDTTKVEDKDRSNLEHKETPDPAVAERTKAVEAARKALTDKKIDFTGKTEDEILALAKPAPRSAPKAWKKEMHEHYGKLPPEVQDYIDSRENEVSEGFKGYAEDSKYGKSLKEVILPYQAMLDSQGIKDHGQAVRYLMNAHYQLSNTNHESRARYFAQLAKSYQIDLGKAGEFLKTDDGYVDPAVKELADRQARLEQERQQEKEASFRALKAKTDAEVKAFAEDPKNSHFETVADHIVLLLRKPGMTLEAAYEQACWANPVVRAKLQAEQKTAAEAELRKKAEEERKKAEKARGTKIRDHGRSSPKEPLGSMDDTMHDTLKSIRARS